ncbi:MAG: hypothetical protein PF439_05800 [Helicobacteraceae bacterium]|jgi:hypothetical protein|nr:hypothetical protein [Helicobacteraceae bacterium]
MKNLSLLKHLLIFATILLVVSGCAHQPVPNAYAPPGFFTGFLHGFIILFSFIGSIFTDVRIYAFPNSGFSYDFGYFLGVSFFGAIINNK